MKKVRRLLLVFMMVLAYFTLPHIHANAASGTFTQESYNGRSYKLFVPSSYQPGTEVPMMVMLHGCTQSPDQFAAGTRMNDLASSENFIVIYPEQTSSANASRCWNWFETSHQQRGSGEPAMIAGMVNNVKSQYAIDDDKVFAAGISAGGAMSVIMGATYPDIFSGIGVSAGLEFKAATSMTQAFTAMSSGGPSPTTQGDLAYQEMQKSTVKVMPTIVFHGTSDYTVGTVNGNQVVEQWIRTNDRADDGQANNSINASNRIVTTGQVSGGRSYTRYQYLDTSSNSIVEKYEITGMGHAWSGGSTAGNYTDSTGPDATTLMWEFFNQNESTPPVEPEPDVPVVSFTPGSQSFSEQLQVSLSATNNPDAIYYSFDGVDYMQYTESILITATTTIYAKAENEHGVSQVRQETYTKETAPTYEVASGTATQHYMAGRLDVGSYIAMGQKYGYQTIFNLYLIQGSSVWTDIDPNPDPEPNPEPGVAPIVTISPSSQVFSDSIEVTMTATESGTIYYSFDGINYNLYQSGLQLTETTTVYAKAENEYGVSTIKQETYTKESVPTYETAVGTAAEHYVAGRLDLAGYLAMGQKYGYVVSFTLYRLAGSSIWTDTLD